MHPKLWNFYHWPHTNFSITFIISVDPAVTFKERATVRTVGDTWESSRDLSSELRVEAELQLPDTPGQNPSAHNPLIHKQQRGMQRCTDRRTHEKVTHTFGLWGHSQGKYHTQVYQTTEAESTRGNKKPIQETTNKQRAPASFYTLLLSLSLLYYFQSFIISTKDSLTSSSAANHSQENIIIIYSKIIIQLEQLIYNHYPLYL